MTQLHDKVILINIQKNLHDVSTRWVDEDVWTCWVDDDVSTCWVDDDVWTRWVDDVWTCWVDEGVVDSLKLLVTDSDVSKW